jgi:hypothetical protein
LERRDFETSARFRKIPLAAIIEFEQRFYCQSAAVAAVRDMGTEGWRAVPHGTGEWRLRLRTDPARLVLVLSELKRRFPLREYRVLEDGAFR